MHKLHKIWFLIALICMLLGGSYGASAASDTGVEASETLKHKNLDLARSSRVKGEQQKRSPSAKKRRPTTQIPASATPANIALIKKIEARGKALVMFIQVLTWLAFISLAIVFASLYVIFEKFGQPGWSALIPGYNLYVLVNLINRPIYWLLIWILPTVFYLFSLVIQPSIRFSLIYGAINLVGFIYQMRGVFILGELFGKSTKFKVGLMMLPFVFFPLLARSNLESSKSTPSST